ncbi:CheR family methyltransferase [Natrialbaceae archaeon A-arb3/5]
MTDNAFTAILEFVEDELSFATSHYNEGYLERRIASRKRRIQCETDDAYLEVLRTDPDEQEALLEAMSINVTEFFRNPEVWNAIRTVLRALSRSVETVDVWSAACADGREAYSLAMLAHDDPQLDPSAIRIHGTDISESALETARNGVYTASQTIDLSDQLSFLDDHSPYVDVDGQTYRISDELKQTVTFERHDLINDGPKSGFDLVVCRNLFMYIDSEYKRSVLRTIEQSLRPRGFLVIGKAETIPSSVKPIFAVCDARRRIYRRE